MRTIKLLALAATAATIALLTSCTNNDDIAPGNGSFPADGVIRVATNVTDSPFQGGKGNGTRAGQTSNGLRRFSLKIENKNTNATVANKYSYYAYMEKDDTNGWGSYELDGDNQPTIDLPMQWQNSMQIVEVTAMSYGSALLLEADFNNPALYSVLSDQSTDDGIQNCDYLYMPTTTITPNQTGQGGLTADGKLLINFVHLMSKVNLTLTLGTEFNAAPGTTTNPITSLMVNGTQPYICFNASTGEMMEYDDTAFSITPWTDTTPGGYTPGTATTSAVAKYEVILAPQTVATGTFTVSFAIGGKRYVWKSTEELKFESGTQYTLALTAGKNIVSAHSMTANPWQPGTIAPGSGSLETE